MSNSYFDHPASGSRYVNFEPLTGDDLNTTFDAVSTGLDKLPTPAKVNGSYAHYAAATGSTNAYVLSLSSQITAYADGLAARFKANAANTGAATLNINSIGAKSIVRPGGAALEAADIANGQIVEVWYDSTNDRFQLSAIVSGDAAPASTYSGTAAGVVDLLTGASVASASTVNLNGTTGNRVHITGTTQINAVTLTRGPRTIVFDGALTLVHHATNNNLPTPGGANITTAAGDRAIYEGDGTSVYCVDYIRANGRPIIPTTYSARTSNTVLGAADYGKLIDITSGTFSQTFAAAATLGAGWECYIRNSGTGDVTLDPDGAETIDGLASFIMYPGEVRLIHCDGLALRSVVLTPFARTFTASGTFTKPPGYSVFGGLLWGGGGGGGMGSAGAYSAGGGGGGACVPFAVQASALSATETVTIAAGGAGAASTGDGAVGGNSSFAGVTAYGGGGGGGNAGADRYGGGGGGALGVGSAGSAAGIGGGSPVSGTSVAGNFGGGSGGGFGSVYGGSGGGSAAGAVSQTIYGGAGGAGISGAGAAGTAGASAYGGAGGAAADAAVGTAGSAPGGGGGATRTGASAGAGARGELRVWGVV